MLYITLDTKNEQKSIYQSGQNQCSTNFNGIKCVHKPYFDILEKMSRMFDYRMGKQPMFMVIYFCTSLRN